MTTMDILAFTIQKSLNVKPPYFQMQSLITNSYNQTLLEIKVSFDYNSFVVLELQLTMDADIYWKLGSD